MYLTSISCAVLTGECGCAAGFSEACKHVFALLHHIEHHVTLGHNKTCTSKEQIWNKSIDKKGEKIHRPAVLSEITFDRPHPGYEADYVRRKRSTFDPRPLQNRASCPINWNKLHATSGGHSSILCFNTNAFKSDHQYERMTTAEYHNEPLTMQTIVNEAGCEEHFPSLLSACRTSSTIAKIEKMTLEQSSNDKWFLYRNGIITATVAHSVIAKYKREPSTQAIENTIAKIIGISKHVRTAATSYVNEYEHYARLRYVKKSKSAHKKFLTSKAGLRLHPIYPVLGASVDGYVNCSCCG